MKGGAGQPLPAPPPLEIHQAPPVGGAWCISVPDYAVMLVLGESQQPVSDTP